MDRKLIITRETLKKTPDSQPCPYQVCALYEGNRMLEVALQPDGTESILNNIYIARVKNVAANLNAAFVEIGNGQLCFLPFEDMKKPLFTKKISKKPIAAGDELAVQVTKEAMKTKDAVVTANLSFPGEYLVLTSADTRIGVSSKLTHDVRDRLQEFAKQLFAGQSAGQLSAGGSPEGDLPEEKLPAAKQEDRPYGLIIRTNAALAEEDALRAEFVQLQEEYQELVSYAASRTAYSCLRKERPFYLKMLTDTYKSGLGEAVTDDPKVYENLKPAVSGSYALRLYEDAVLPLARLYNVAGQIEAALRPRVWLRSGANIIIQPTEALTVIDVNSGKNTAKHAKQQNHYKIDLEAAGEIAVQLRLRNISGIIIVDFIDLYDDALNAALLAEFRSYLKQDPVPVNLVGMTKLGLVELTRKKQKKPLAEQMQ